VKAKWVQPFSPFLLLAFPPPPDFVVRCMFVFGLLVVVAAYLAMARPWEDEKLVRRA
jgi:hypothetical protein